MTLQERLIPLIEFDLQQYFLNMHFSTFLNADPSLICKREYLWHAPHNMGIVIAGMVDLACSDHIEWQEMAAMRELFYCAQRSGHICNTLTTRDREMEEGCVSNEIQLRILHGNNGSEEDIIEFLRRERVDLYQKISDKSLKTFSTVDYVQGLQQLQALHEDLQKQLKLKSLEVKNQYRYFSTRLQQNDWQTNLVAQQVYIQVCPKKQPIGLVLSPIEGRELILTLIDTTGTIKTDVQKQLVINRLFEEHQLGSIH